MANKFITPLPPVIGVTASAVATLDIPVGPRYHVIWLDVSGKTRSSAVPTLSDVLGDIKVKVNGRVQRIHSATEINAIQSNFGQDYSVNYATAAAPNALLGFVQSAGTLATYAAPTTALTANTTAYRFRVPIFLAEPWRKQYVATDAMAWPTTWPGGKGLIGTFQIEITCGANVADNGITAYAEMDYQQGVVDANGNPVLQVSKWNRLDIPVGTVTAADQYITSLPRQDIYQQISIFTADTSKYVSSIKVKVENNVIRDVTKGQLDISNLARGMNPNALLANRFDLIFDYDDLPSSALPMIYGGKQVQDFQVIPNMTTDAGTTMRVAYQTFGPLA